MFCRAFVAIIFFSFTLTASSTNIPPVRENNVDVVAASKFTELTTLSISPLLVGGLRNARAYWNASEIERSRLPWHTQPWFWGPLLGMGILFLIHTFIGRVFPPTAKFMDAIETIEGKLTLLYTSPLVINSGIELTNSLASTDIPFSPIGNAFAAGSTTGNPIDSVIGAIIGLAIFWTIWLTNQAVHTIVLLSPSGAVSAAIRFLQLMVLLLLISISSISPTAGAITSLLLIFICAKIAGWSFRLSVFGTIFAWDLILFRTNHPTGNEVLAFSAEGLPLPIRTMGKLRCQNGNLELIYRPWLIRNKKTISIPENNRILTHGILYTNIHRTTPKGEVTLVTLPPRYRGKENDLALFAICELNRASLLKGGFSTLISWLKFTTKNK